MFPVREDGLHQGSARSREFSFDFDFKPFFCGGNSGRAFIDRDLQLVSPGWQVFVCDFQLEAAVAVIIGFEQHQFVVVKGGIVVQVGAGIAGQFTDPDGILSLFLQVIDHPADDQVVGASGGGDGDVALVRIVIVHLVGCPASHMIDGQFHIENSVSFDCVLRNVGLGWLGHDSGRQEHHERQDECE